MQLRDIPFSALFGSDPATAYTARCDFSRTHHNSAHLISRAVQPRLRPAFLALLAFALCLPMVLSGCGGGAIILTPANSGSLQSSPAVVSFGAVPYGQTQSSNVSLVNDQSAEVQVSQINVTGQAFSASLNNDLPITVPAGGTYNFNVNFSPAATGAATGQVTVSSNSPTDGTLVIGLNGMGTAVSAGTTATLSVLSCANGSLTGAGTDSCTVMLTGAAPSGGLMVTLASDDSAVAVPTTVTVQAGETSATFTASATAVGTAQTATLTAAAGSVSETFALQLGAVLPSLSFSTNYLSFGTVNLNTEVQQTLSLTSTGNVSVTVSAAAATGPGFTFSGQNLPFTLDPNQTATLTVQFDPTVAGPAFGQLTLTTNLSTGPSAVISLSGAGQPVLNGLSCTIGSITGTGSDNCTVTLNPTAPSGGLMVNLASDNSAVVIPASVTVPAGASSASFTATISSVSSAQTAMLTASADGISETFPLQLNAAAAGLSINATSIAFGDVEVNSALTQSVELTASGPLPIAITAATAQGSGFSISGATFPLTLTDGQAATVEVSFDPTAVGAATGQLVIASTSLAGGAAAISLSGTGQLEEVNLNWDAPSSSADPIAGYNVYRAPGGDTSYQQLNASTLNQTTYVDTAVQPGETYDYIVESVDAAGVTSTPSNTASVTLP
jgi:Abnormal spindle-like microcephaly-assoc'd, ASPM-SPD-2-Hydin